MNESLSRGAVLIGWSALVMGCQSWVPDDFPGGRTGPEVAAPSEQLAEVQEELQSSVRFREDGATRAPLKMVREGEAWLQQPAPEGGFENLFLKEALPLMIGEAPFRLDPALSSAPVALTLEKGVSMEDALDRLASQADAHYRFADGVLHMLAYETRSIPVAAPMTSRETSMTPRALNAGLGGGGGGASSTVSASVAPSAELLAMLESVTAVDGQASVSYSDAANLLQVRARPSMMREIVNLVRSFDQATTRRVAMEVTLYEVDVTDAKHHALDLTVVRNYLNSGLTKAAFNIQGASSVDVTTTGEPALSFEFSKEGDVWNGSSAILRALRNLGATEVASRFRVETGHGQAIVTEDLTQSPYISTISRDQEFGGGTTQASINVETETLETGSVLHVLPTISNNRVWMQLTLSVSSTISLEAYSFNDGQVAGNLPTVASKNHMFNFALRSGESRLVANLGRVSKSTNKGRNPLLPLLGESRARTNRVVETVMLVTAVVMNT